CSRVRYYYGYGLDSW
nr:immunoglobulin heavy chain junction region [Macaca mulatta]MOV39660.1 immunoglobulin heavy chain junction region [Macaca mulatta]MOV40352.1 immunoglobulin heavy chain junction region [Macaca mulatta]MOV40655.1 immunoglobulin heavy chain junction region [Macaca mulatta]MOV41454.1 immunoglobulin heavy chain junction region [Macaca mulatta]